MVKFPTLKFADSVLWSGLALAVVLVCLGVPDCLDCSPPEHLACVNSNSCEIVPGAGADECSAASECIGRNVCLDGACKFVPGDFIFDGPSCSNSSECEGHHLACTGNRSCSLVPGEGTSSCVSNFDCGFMRKACRGDACELIAGNGSDTCDGPSDCTGETHLECNAEAECVPTPGVGPDRCQSSVMCASDTPKQVCRDQQCISVYGQGESDCSDSSACSGKHTKCLQNACTLVDGIGPDECIHPEDCEHVKRACINDACVLVGGGLNTPDACTVDGDCINTPKHLACVGKSKCELVDGEGSNNCGSERNCSHSHAVCRMGIEPACEAVPTQGEDACQSDAQCSFPQP